MHPHIFSMKHHYVLTLKKLISSSLMKEIFPDNDTKKVLTAPFLPQLLWFIFYDFVFW